MFSNRRQADGARFSIPSLIRKLNLPTSVRLSPWLKEIIWPLFPLLVLLVNAITWIAPEMPPKYGVPYAMYRNPSSQLLSLVYQAWCYLLNLTDSSQANAAMGKLSLTFSPRVLLNARISFMHHHEGSMRGVGFFQGTSTILRREFLGILRPTHVMVRRSALTLTRRSMLVDEPICRRTLAN